MKKTKCTQCGRSLNDENAQNVGRCLDCFAMSHFSGDEYENEEIDELDQPEEE